MTIKEFMKEVHATAVAKGWWEKDRETGRLKERNVAEMLALMHSEVAEALEIYRMPDKKLSDLWISNLGGVATSNPLTSDEVEAHRQAMDPDYAGKPEGFMVEIADLMIRIADTCEAMVIPLDVVLCNTDISRLGWGRDMLDCHVGEQLQHLNVCLVHAFNAIRNGRATDTAAASFAEIFHSCGHIAKAFGVSLDYALVWKMRYNETRSFRHGNKKC